MSKLNLDYKIKLNEEELKNKDEVYANITASYLASCVTSKYEKGLEGQKRRTWGRIQRKIDEAIETKTYTLTLESAEQDFIEECFKDAKFPVHLAKHTLTFEDDFIKKMDEKPEIGADVAKKVLKK